MNKRLILTIAAALTAVPFLLLPNAASAGFFGSRCSGTSTCVGAISATGNMVFEESSGLRITCSEAGGSASFFENTSTGEARLLLAGCKESVFGTNCGNTVTAGQITTNNLSSHLIYLEQDKSIKGLLLTGLNVTLSCTSGAIKKTITGNVMGEIENPECGVFRTHHTVLFEAGISTGSQRWTSITTSGTIFDLTMNNDSGGAYSTTSLSGTVHITYEAGTSVVFNC